MDEAEGTSEQCFKCPKLIGPGEACFTCGHLECPYRLSPMERAAEKRKFTLTELKTGILRRTS
jgi:hypothetical protein